MAEFLGERACLGVLLPFKVDECMCVRVSRAGAAVSGATRHGLLIGFPVPGSSQDVTGARTRHPVGDDPLGACKGGNRTSSVASKFSRNHLSVARGLLS